MTLKMARKGSKKISHRKFLKYTSVNIKTRKKVGKCARPHRFFCAKISPYGSKYIYNAFEFASLQNLVETCNKNRSSDLLFDTAGN